MFIGIDVAKADLVVAVHPSEARWTVANDERLTFRVRVGSGNFAHASSGPALVISASR